MTTIRDVLVFKSADSDGLRVIVIAGRGEGYTAH
jgi:hypothetical protein